MFLQKTYHMIETCDDNVCSWSEDGLTFVVKNVKIFENTIIPQFFKHSKFTSFVRQLNFYGFNKIKFSDSLRIDPKLEAATASYWRFKHDKFIRGRQDLLVEIKRGGHTEQKKNSHSSTPATVMTMPPTPKVTAVPNSVSSNPNVVKAKACDTNENLKTEVQELKQRMESMTKNMDDLTSLVKNISVKDGDASPFEPGQKRKKRGSVKEDVVMEDLPMMPDWSPSSSEANLFPSLLGDAAPFPDMATSSEISMPSPTVSDAAFVDDMFQVFADEGGELDVSVLENSSDTTNSSSNSDNTPDPQLMKRIEDSLSTIPRDMHEMVANKLIDAIANTRPIAQSATALFSPVVEGPVESNNNKSISSSAMVDVENDNVFTLQQAQVTANDDDVASLAPATPSATGTVNLPLAVATLRTILAEYGVSVECHRTPCKEEAGEDRRLTKSLPVVHA